MSNALNCLLAIKPVAEPLRFIGLLRSIAERVEHGETHSIGVDECQKWGYNPQEACALLTLLAQAGIVRQKVRVFDESNRLFVDTLDGQDFSNVDPDCIQVWYTPCVRKEDFERFFVDQPAHLAPAM
jgi:hypothetical protein